LNRSAVIVIMPAHRRNFSYYVAWVDGHRVGNVVEKAPEDDAVGEFVNRSANKEKVYQVNELLAKSGKSNISPFRFVRLT
jgi:hypothetical protein